MNCVEQIILIGQCEVNEADVFQMPLLLKAVNRCAQARDSRLIKFYFFNDNIPVSYQ